MFGLDHAHGKLCKIPDYRFHVAAYIADLCKFRSLDLDKRSIVQLCKPSRYLGLAYTGAAYHDYVFWQDLFLQVRREHLPPPPIPHCDCDRFLRLLLTDDIFVQFFDDFSGC